MKTADIVLCSGNGVFSKLIQAGTGSKFSHVALFAEHPELGGVIYESTSLGKLPDMITGEPICGVQIVPFEERVKTYDGKVYLLPIIGERTSNQLDMFHEHMVECHGTPYEKSNRQLAYAALDLLPWQDNDPDPSSLFCSEYATYALRQMGLMQEGSKPPNEYTPADFNGSIELCDGYSFGDLKQLK